MCILFILRRPPEQYENPKKKTENVNNPRTKNDEFLGVSNEPEREKKCVREISNSWWFCLSVHTRHVFYDEACDSQIWFDVVGVESRAKGEAGITRCSVNSFNEISTWHSREVRACYDPAHASVDESQNPFAFPIQTYSTFGSEKSRKQNRAESFFFSWTLWVYF